MTDSETVNPIRAPIANAHRLFAWGLAASVTYIAALAIYAWTVRSAMLNMKPDEFATFLSGVFAPLAFMWLVLGFRQQGDELKNSAAALWLQGEELRNSVEQQRQLVEVSRDQLAAEYAERVRSEREADQRAQPQLLFAKNGGASTGERRVLRFVVRSAGPTCSEVRVNVEQQTITSAGVLTESGELKFSRVYERSEDMRAFDAEVTYTDARGNRRAQKWHIPVDDTGGPRGIRTLGNPLRITEVEKRTPPAAPEGS